jgi:hypothetical protein
MNWAMAVNMKSNPPNAPAEQGVKEEGIHPERNGSVKCESCPIFYRILKLNLARIRQLPLFGCMGLGPTEMILQLLCHSST